MSALAPFFILLPPLPVPDRSAPAPGDAGSRERRAGRRAARCLRLRERPPPASLLACAPAAAASATVARTGTGPMLARPILAFATWPLERCTSAATPTIAQACAVRWRHQPVSRANRG